MSRLYAILCTLVSLSMACFAGDLPKLVTLTLKSGREYHNVKVTQKRSDGISIMHDSGATRIKCEDLPEGLVKKLGGFDPKEVAKIRAQEKDLVAVADAEIARKSAEQAREKERKALLALSDKVEPPKKQQATFAVKTPEKTVRPAAPQPAKAATDHATELRELDARILATRQQMAELLKQAQSLAGNPSLRMLMQATQMRIDLTQSSLNSLIFMRNDLNHYLNGAVVPSSISQGRGNLAKIDKENDGVLILGNKAVVQVTGSYLGYLGYNTDCLLFRDGARWKILIKGKQPIPCDLLREPEYGVQVEFSLVSIREIRAEAGIVILSDGRIFKVNQFDQFGLRFIRFPQDAVLLGSEELIIIDDWTKVSVTIIAE